MDKKKRKKGNDNTIKQMLSLREGSVQYCVLDDGYLTLFSC